MPGAPQLTHDTAALSALACDATDQVHAGPRLTDSWMLGPLSVPNRVLLAPLAGIGNWFVRLQAKRYGAGMAFSEMVSSHAIHHRNEKTCVEMLRIHPAERQAGTVGGGSVGESGSAEGSEPTGELGRESSDGSGRDQGDRSWRDSAGGPVSIQLFGESPSIMRSAAAHVAKAGADAIDINMGCPVRKVCKTGAGVGLLGDPDRAIALARAAYAGVADAGRELPVTVKLRSGLVAGDTSGFELAHRLVEEAGVAAIAFHPRSAAVHHKGEPDYELAARLVQSLPAPVILTGGLHDAARVRSAHRFTGAAAVMLARGSLGNPWLFSRLLGRFEREPTRHEVLDELCWTIQRAIEHLGEPRAMRYLRKFYPWYVDRLGLDSAAAKRLNESLQRTATLDDARQLLGVEPMALPAAA